MSNILIAVIIFFLLVAALRDILAIVRCHPVFVGGVILILAAIWYNQNVETVSTILGWIWTAVKIFVAVILITAFLIALADEGDQDEENQKKEK